MMPMLTYLPVMVAESGDSPLRAARKRLGLSMAKVGKSIGTSRQQIQKLELGIVKMTRGWAEKLSPVVGVPVEVLILGESTVPLVGFVGAGLELSYFADGQGPFDRVRMPPNGSGATVGVEVRGDSLGTAFTGWIAYYDDRREPPTDDLLNKLCIVGLKDGRILIKRLIRGREPGRYDLWAPNANPLLDQEVDWAARVSALLPRD